MIALEQAVFDNEDRVQMPGPASTPNNPAQKYQFRLLYFICKDGEIISANVQRTNAYQERKQCEPLIENRTIHKHSEDKTKPLPKESIEGFWLVPEKLWWILAPFAKEFLIKDRTLLPGK